MQSIHNLREKIKEHQPLIHCITNPISINQCANAILAVGARISINQCANAILAVGARPIMAEHPKEVREITDTASALMLNLGNITDARMTSMQISAQAAKEKNIPILLDAVGIACSKLRRDYVCDLLKTVVPTVIKGNYSEINALYHEAYRSSGVDADAALDERALDRVAAQLARAYHTVILASGKVDIVTDGTRLVHIKNGTPQLSGSTGTGCMLGALTASYLSAKPDMDAAITACVMLGICGQLSKTDRGSGSFMINLMDALSTVKDVDIEQRMDMEEIEIEEL